MGLFESHSRLLSQSCLLQASLSKMGIDPTAAVERARSRSRSRVGRKRTRSVAGGEAMDVDGGDGAQPAAKKRVHSSKSRCALQS